MVTLNIRTQLWEI